MVRDGQPRRRTADGTAGGAAGIPDAGRVAELERRLPDLGDPDTLSRFAIRPDALASHDRRVTQAISRKLHGEGMLVERAGHDTLSPRSQNHTDRSDGAQPQLASDPTGLLVVQYDPVSLDLSRTSDGLSFAR